ncbi:carbohydrate kinase family protein [Candidatus Dojkabacteria bacterium]|nr:carbohydrate kinase family protein [Candidatus Dojkabacteria bacterium]
MHVLGIGEIVLDKVNLLNRFPEEGEKVQPQKVEYSVGGPVPSALILLSRLGVKCTLISTVGEDDAYEKIKSKLKRENIQFIPRTARSTKVNTVLINSKNGSRTIIRDGVRHLPISGISERIIKSSDIILFDRHEPKAFEEILNKKRSDTKIIIDPSTEVSTKIFKMLAKTDFPIIPYESLSKFRIHEGFDANLNDVYRITKKTVVITLGEKGSLIFDGKKTTHVPALQVPAIDTLGAGDIFRGAFGYGVLQKWSIQESVEYANLVSALQCTKLGNYEAIPTKREIEKFRATAVSKLIEYNLNFD